MCGIGNSPPTPIKLLQTIVIYVYFENTDQKGGCLCSGSDVVIITLTFLQNSKPPLC